MLPPKERLIGAQLHRYIRDKQSYEKVLEDGLKQIIGYRDVFSSSLRNKTDKPIPCYLLIFDRRSEDRKLPWEQRISWEKHGDIAVLGC